MSRLFDKAVELKPDYFDAIASCLVLAPHPDDESLGCGGLLSLLRDKEKEVNVIFITDGSMSHPRSQKFSPEALAALRKEEALHALAALQVSQSGAFFLHKKDGALPAKGENEFEQNVNQMHLLIALLQPDLILVPYEKDPHRDHRATWQMLMQTNKKRNASYQVLEYLIWLHERGKDSDMPDENAFRYVDITPYLQQKKNAVHKHLSQTTRLIDDDANGFILSPQVLQHFITPKEYYVERLL